VGDAGQDRAIVSTELVGQRIMDRYRISERVARGGMSVVYRGEDERLRRPVCVKVFCGLDPSRPGYRTVHEHFVQEAFALSTLRHPNTIRIYDFGYLEDELATPFFVVEYADGGTLKEFVRKHGPLSAHETFEILEPIAEALREAHAAGIIHRDIKPSNILFTRAGPSLVVKLADFSTRFPTGPTTRTSMRPTRSGSTRSAGRRPSSCARKASGRRPTCSRWGSPPRTC
jgi:serine/threonine protein kinase